jgi:hypothetical protein
MASNPMKPELVQKLSTARDLYALTRSVLVLCEPYGPVHSFKLTHNRGTSRVACVIELESPKQHNALARELGARALSGAVCMEVPVAKDFDAAGRMPLSPRPVLEARVAG